MKHSRSLLVLAASAGIAACGDQVSTLVAPTTGLESANSGAQNPGGGYTWTIKKELVEVHKMTLLGEMIPDPVSPYSIALGKTEWFTFRITYTRTNGGTMGPTAVISDDVAGACSMLGFGYACTSVDSEFGLTGGGGAVGIKTWSVSSSGHIEGMLDIGNQHGGCPSDRMLKNTAVLTSNHRTISSDAEVPINSPNCAGEKPRCNQGVGNGPEGCDPGNSNHNQPSNDENGGKPGSPGRKGS